LNLFKDCHQIKVFPGLGPLKMLKNEPDLAKKLTVVNRTYPGVAIQPYAIYGQILRNLDFNAIYGGENMCSPIIRVISDVINFEIISYIFVKLEFALTLRILNNWVF